MDGQRSMLIKVTVELAICGDDISIRNMHGPSILQDRPDQYQKRLGMPVGTCNSSNVFSVRNISMIQKILGYQRY